ncbi:MAG TPA: hypothetical protein DCR12_02145 [Lachnospiraceae bacterium]|nr:hypothetical protein [Lachnospiraceae bacterium]
MKKCLVCGIENEDNNEACTQCGANLNEEELNRDIKNNKAVSIFVYLLDILGIIVGYVAGLKSEYAAFHAREALKIKVTEVIFGIIIILICVVIGTPWIIISSSISFFGLPSLGIFWVMLGIYSIAKVLFWVLRLIGAINAAKGKYKKAPLVGTFPFL